MSDTTLPKEHRKLAALARQQGWTISMTGGNHLSWNDPTGKFVTTSPSTPSEFRGTANLLRDLRNAGLIDDVDKWKAQKRTVKKIQLAIPGRMDQAEIKWHELALHSQNPPLRTTSSVRALAWLIATIDVIFDTPSIDYDEAVNNTTPLRPIPLQCECGKMADMLQLAVHSFDPATDTARYGHNIKVYVGNEEVAWGDEPQPNSIQCELCKFWCYKSEASTMVDHLRSSHGNRMEMCFACFDVVEDLPYHQENECLVLAEQEPADDDPQPVQDDAQDDAQDEALSTPEQVTTTVMASLRRLDAIQQEIDKLNEESHEILAELFGIAAEATPSEGTEEI